MRPAFFAVLAAGLLLLPFSAQAQAPEEEVPITGSFAGGLEGEPVTVNIAPSARMLDPVAIPEAICRCTPAHCKAVYDTLNRDLMLSAFFTVLDKRSYLADPASEGLEVSKWDDWFNIGAKYLVKASLEGSGDTCALTFRLYDVSLRKYMEVKDSDPGTVPSAKLVPATHAFVNALIEAITGVPGIFGNMLVYSARTGKGSRAVYQIGVDGRDKAVLAGGGTLNLFPSLANGALVFTSFRTGTPEVYVNGKRVTRGGKQYRGARLSPDGGLLAASADNGSGQSELYLLSKDGKLIKELSDTPWDEVSPVWSYDGAMLAFVSNRTGGPQVYVMDRDGGSVRRVTMAGGYNSTPDFGPDNRIVFAGMDEARSDIFVTDLEGNITRITQDQGNNKDPAFSPDGRYIAFVSNRDGGWKIYLSTSDGRYQFPITDTTGGYSTLFWVR